MSETLQGVLIGGLLTAIGSFVVAFTMDRRSSQHHQRAVQIEAARGVLASLQNLNRKLISIARHPKDTLSDNTDLWAEQIEAATRWNAARYGAALLCPTKEVGLLDTLDREVDRVLDQALSKEWTGRTFRSERVRLGELAAEYLMEVRRSSGQPHVRIDTSWAWDDSRSVANNP